MAIQDDNTVLCKGDLKAYHEQILPYLGGNLMLGTNVSDYYDTTERIVGVWTDGRPVYQKVITGTTPSVTTATDFNTGITNGSHARIINGFVESTAGYGVPCNYYFTENNYGFTRVTSDASKITMNTALTSRPFYITIQYTKTTDASNSAISTPGCYDINRPDLWPANKEIFFGNGLYGFRGTGTYNVTANTPTSKTITTIITNAKSTTKIFNYGGTLKRGNGASSSDTILGLGYGANVWTSLLLDNTGLVMYNYDTTARSNIPYDIWVTYTK